LKRKTGMSFIPYKMDIKTLEENKKNWIRLSENDKVRLKLLAEKSSEFKSIIDFMIENDCKLEQESISLS
ncbi:MAG: hypothetical protein II579_02115, partial [Treponema sp.]|nr:hypothetical protein [Treponema sp.]